MMRSNGLPATGLGRWKIAAVVLSIAASVVAGYLGYVSLQLRGTPWGCGAGSGCADVLKSRWSNVAGIPVGFFAVAAYLVLATLAAFSKEGRGAAALTTAASIVLTTAMYFVALQLVVIRAICPWCMLDHSLGVLAAIVALVIARRLTPRVARDAPTAAKEIDPLAEYDASPVAPARRKSALGSVATGAALALAFVVVQHFTARMPDVARIESQVEEQDPQTGALTLALKNGEASLPVSSLPVIGSTSAPKRLILMFDYCCPHCREAHHVIRRLQPTAGDQWQVLFVPCPLNSDCNPGVEETEPRFKDACALARLSLAVWKLRPNDWVSFDTWLFEPELPRTIEEAHQHAAALYGELELAEVLAKSVVNSVIDANVRAYQASGSKVLPVILSPGSAGIAGRTDGEEELRAILSTEFGFPTP